MTKDQAAKRDQLTRDVLDMADLEYASLKMKKGYCDAYTPPEAMPAIRSDQIRALAHAFATALVERGMA